MDAFKSLILSKTPFHEALNQTRQVTEIASVLISRGPNELYGVEEKEPLLLIPSELVSIVDNG